MSTSTYAASGSSSDGNLDAESTITISGNDITIDLSSLEGNPTSAGQEVSGIEITFASPISSPSLTSQSGSLIDIGQGGTVTSVSGSPMHWGAAESGDTLYVATQGTGSPGGKPSDLIIGPPNGSGLCSNANSSITGHLPSIQDTGTFDVSANSIPAGDTISSVSIEFGTMGEHILAAPLVCFMPGTTIATPNGAAAVETLAIGDLVRTKDGQTYPILWIGRQTVSTRFADPLRVLPIRVKAGALGDNLPVRDLLVSPAHALLVGDILIQAGALVNGTSIVRESNVPETFVYYHIELEDHSLILAEGVAAETFVDNVSRENFDNWAEHEQLFPEGRAVREMEYPRAQSARQVPRHVRALLTERQLHIAGGIAAAA